MKNIAIPLLVAGSAQAQRPAAMRQDVDVPAPLLIAAGIHSDGCEDSEAGFDNAVAPAALAVSTARQEVDRLEGERDTADTGVQALVEAAVTAKAAAVAAALEEQGKDATINAISAADAAAEAERDAERTLADARLARDAGQANIDALTISVAALNTAKAAAAQDATDYLAAKTAAEGHLNKDRQTLAASYCRLQATGWVALVDEQDAALVGTAANATAIKQGDGSCTVPALTDPDNGDAEVRAAEAIAADGGRTAALSTAETARDAASAFAAASALGNRTAAEKLAWRAGNLAGKDWESAVAADAEANHIAKAALAATTLTAATNDINAATDPSAAKTAADADSALADPAGLGNNVPAFYSHTDGFPTNKELGAFATNNKDAATGDQSATWKWYAAASVLSTKGNAWNTQWTTWTGDASTAFTALTGGTADAECDDHASGTNTTTPTPTGADDAAKLLDCRAKCAAKALWSVAADGLARKKLPDPAFLATLPLASGDTYCFAFSYKAADDSCTLYHADVSSGIAASGSDTTACYQTNVKTATQLTEYAAAYAAVYGSNSDTYASPGGSSVQAGIDGGLTAITALAKTSTSKGHLLRVATEYQALINTAKGNLDSATAGLTTAKNNAASAAGTALNDYNTDKATSDGLVNAVNAAQALVNESTANITAGVADVAEQVRVLALATADSDDAATASTAADTAWSTQNDLLTTATNGQAALATAVTDAEGALATAVTAREGAEPDLSVLTGLRTAATEAGTALDTALANLATAQAAIDAAQDTLDEALAAQVAAVVACKEEQFDAYARALATAVAERAAALDNIEALIAAQEANKPAPGEVGARCEKALSNGTFRPSRNENTCTGETLCCGAARVPVGGGWMTIETCQENTASTYAYAPPRAPLATTMPGSVDYPFTCIEGAQKLAAAASALAAAVYMLA